MPTLRKLLLVVLLGGELAVGAAVSPADGTEPRLIRPRSIAAFSFVVINPGEDSLTRSWEISLPFGWSPLGAVSGTVVVSAGDERRLPLLFSVPADASPGPGTLTLVLRDPRIGEELARIVKPYTVLAAGRLTFHRSEDDPVVIGDAPFRVRRWLENGSNVAVRVDLEADSSNEWKIELEPSTLELAPGAGVWVDALVTPPLLLGSEASHTLSVSALTPDLPEGQREARFRETTRFLSTGDGGTSSRLQGSIELESYLPAGGSAGVGLNLRLAGNAGAHNRVDLRIGQRLPVGDVGALSRRDTYLDVDNDSWGGFRIGRSTRHFSRLTATNQRGSWGEVRLRSPVGTWTAFSSLSDPDSVWGKMAGLSLELPERRGARFGVQAFQGEGAPNAPDSEFSMGSIWGKGHTATSRWDMELAAGRLDGMGDVEPALRFGLTGDSGRWSWSGEGQGASARFPGAVWNHRQFGARVGYDVTPSLEVWAAGDRLLSPDLSLDPAADAFTRQVGVTWPGLRFGSLALSRSHTSFGATASQPESIENLWNLWLHVDLRDRLVAKVNLAAGEREEAGDRETLVRTGYELRYRSRGIWSLRGRYQPAPRGEEIFGYEDRWSAFARWQTGRRSWVELEGEQLTCGRLADSGCESDPSVRLSLGQTLEESRAGWRLIGFLQKRGGQNDLTAGLRVARNLGGRLPFPRMRSKVLGTFRTSDGEPGPAGVRLYLGERTARTTRDGEFRFNSVPPGDHLLQVEPTDLGLSLMVDRPLPIPVRRVGKQPATVDLRLVRPGRITGKALIEDRPRSRADAGVGDSGPDWAPFGKLGLHFEHTVFPELRHTAVSGLNGELSVAGLLPGRWRVWVHSADVPPGRDIDGGAGEFLVHVREGETVKLDPIFLVWRERPETLVEMPVLTLGGARSRELPSGASSAPKATPTTNRTPDLLRAIPSAPAAIAAEAPVPVAGPAEQLTSDSVGTADDSTSNWAPVSDSGEGPRANRAFAPPPASSFLTRDRRRIVTTIVLLLAIVTVSSATWVLRRRT